MKDNTVMAIIIIGGFIIVAIYIIGEIIKGV